MSRTSTRKAIHHYSTEIHHPGKHTPSEPEFKLSRMLWCKKRICISIFIFTVVFLTTFLYSTNYYWMNNNYHILTQEEFKAMVFNVSNTTITPLKNGKVFIIAAYRDHREGASTRSISIVHKDVKTLFCFYSCRNNNHIRVIKAVIDMHVDRFDFPYCTTDILCMDPYKCDPQYIGIGSSEDAAVEQISMIEIQNLQPSSTFSVEFTVCISTMFAKYNNLLQFVQTIEMYKLLGAKKVMIYKNSCGPLVERVLQYYIAEGTVEIVPWPIEEYLSPANAWHYSLDPKDIGYYGQLATLNDCIYRNMYRSKYVILNDLDEIIIPFKQQDWKSMMDSLRNQYPTTEIFLFENHIFPYHVFTPTDGFNTSLWESVPGVDILKHIHREPDRKDFYNARKLIMNPRKVIQTSVHSVLKAYGDSLKVSNDIALVYHCRSPLQARLPHESLIKDARIWDYKHPLIGNVIKVLERNMFLNTTST